MRLLFSAIFFLTAPFNILSVVYTPQNLIIATDLDDVVLKLKKGSVILTACKNMHRGFRCYAAYRRHSRDGQATGHHYSEGFYLYLKKNGEHKLARVVKKICTRKRLKQKTVNLMKKIADKGYKIFTATNIGSVFFTKLKKKFSHIFNDFFIRHGMTVDFSRELVIRKPDPAYFHELKKKLDPKGVMHILFIDDRIENVEAARKAGLLAIHYKGHKQLQAELHAYGICVCS